MTWLRLFTGESHNSFIKQQQPATPLEAHIARAFDEMLTES